MVLRLRFLRVTSLPIIVVVANREGAEMGGANHLEVWELLAQALRTRL